MLFIARALVYLRRCYRIPLLLVCARPCWNLIDICSSTVPVDFIVNSQGVFGFINSERVTLVLEFTHDTVTPAPPPPGAPLCVDAKTTPFTGPGAVPLSCSQLVQHCSDRQHGPAISKACPASCGVCSISLQVVGGGDIAWRPLDFMNLPGSVDRRPLFTSPYHYRLDWETWIHTTASFEVSALRAPQYQSAC